MSKKRPSQSVSRCRLYLSQWEAVRGNIRSAKRQSVREHVEKFCYCIWTCGVARGRQSHQKGKGPACAMSTGCTQKSGFHFQGKHEDGEWHDGICALKSEVSRLGENKGTRGRGGTLSRRSERPQHMGNQKSDKCEKVSHFCPCPNKKCQGAKPLASMDYHYSPQTSAPSFTASFLLENGSPLVCLFSIAGTISGKPCSFLFELKRDNEYPQWSSHQNVWNLVVIFLMVGLFLTMQWSVSSHWVPSEYPLKW